MRVELSILLSPRQFKMDFPLEAAVRGQSCGGCCGPPTPGPMFSLVNDHLTQGAWGIPPAGALSSGHKPPTFCIESKHNTIDSRPLDQQYLCCMLVLNKHNELRL